MSFFHTCIGNCENIYFFRLQQNLSSPDNKFLLHTVEAIGKIKYVKKLFRKNVQVQLLNFNFISIKTIGKYMNVKKNSANEFLLHKCRNNRKMKKCYFFSSNLKKCFKSSL